MKNWKSYAVTAGIAAATMIALNVVAGMNVPAVTPLARLATGRGGAATNA